MGGGMAGRTGFRDAYGPFKGAYRDIIPEVENQVENEMETGGIKRLPLASWE